MKGRLKMNSSIVEEKVKKIDSFKGIEVYRVFADKFKTNSINIFFQDNLSRENAAKNALVPAVLRRGCKKYESFKEIALYLEELYGAAFDCGVSKKGEYQIIQFYMDYVSDRYTGKNTNLFSDCLNLLFEIVTKPLLVDGTFKKDFVDQEKDNLRKLIEGRMNDKVQYAVERCFEETCKNEPFEIYEYGSVSDLDSIDPANLYERYRFMLESMPMKIYISGDMEDSKVDEAIKMLKTLKRSDVFELSKLNIMTHEGEVKNVVESLEVSQGKLSLGFRTNTMPNEKAYYDLVVCNSILGGGIHSKLFQNVREKESLAYYAFSRLEKFKGLMVISCGIEIDKKDRAYKVILEQLEEIRKGNISDYEYDSSLKAMQTGLESLKDSQLSVVDFYFSQTIAKTNDSLNSLIEKLKSVTREEVVQAAKRIKLDTVYFLTSSKV